MPSISKDLIILIACLLAVVGAGVYLTFYQQTAELERVEKAEKVAQLKQAEITTLVAEYADSKEQADAVIRKWRSRYKVIPETLSTPSVVGYMNDLTQTGFETFDVSLGSLQHTGDYSYYTLSATGRGYFTSLYHLVWSLENNRAFYGVRDLTLEHIDLVTENEETGRRRLQVMVSFNMQIDAYFSGPEGTSASGSAWQLASADGEVRSATGGVLPPVPAEVLADRRPEVNPFFPVIMDDLPPNTHGLIDVESAAFVSIVGGKAVFKTGGSYRQVGAGDPVYLGQITSVDPLEGRVTARLNRGGIIDEVAVELETGERYRQAIGPALLQPAF